MMDLPESSAVQFGGTRIEYAVRRSARRRTVAVAVDPRLGVLVAAPDTVSLTRLDALVHGKARWIVERLRRVRRTEQPLPQREFVSGESYLYLGRQYRLRVVPVEEPGDTRLAGGRLVVPVQRALRGAERAAAARAAVESWYRRHAAQRLPDRVRQWAGLIGVAEPRVVIRSQQRRWASCDAQGTLRFNWRVVQAPMRLVDYVVAHELVHLRCQEHSKAFWAALGRAMPDYERRAEDLRKIGARLAW